MLKLVLLVLTYWSSSAQLCKDILLLLLEITAAGLHLLLKHSSVNIFCTLEVGCKKIGKFLTL